MPSRKEIDEKTTFDWAISYVYEYESLFSIARRYRVSRSLVTDRLEKFWDTHDGYVFLKQRSEELGITDPLDECECERCEAERRVLARHGNGHGNALNVTG